MRGIGEKEFSQAQAAARGRLAPRPTTNHWPGEGDVHLTVRYTIVELLFVLGMVATLSSVAVPQVLAGLDDFRTAGAARHISARLQRARMDAVVRSADVGLQATSTATAGTPMRSMWTGTETACGPLIFSGEPTRGS